MLGHIIRSQGGIQRNHDGESGTSAVVGVVRKIVLRRLRYIPSPHVTPATNHSIGCPNAVFVEEGRCPSLTGHKCGAEDSNEKPQYIEVLCIASYSGQARRYCAEDK